MLGGYTWASSVDESRSMIYVDIYLFVSGSRSIDLPDGRVANITMSTGMPWHGRTEISLQAPPSWTWNVRIPKPEYVANVEVGVPIFMVINDGLSWTYGLWTDILL